MNRVCPFDDAPVPEEMWDRHIMWHVITLKSSVSALEESEYWTYDKEAFVSTGLIHRSMLTE